MVLGWANLDMQRGVARAFLLIYCPSCCILALSEFYFFQQTRFAMSVFA